MNNSTPTSKNATRKPTAAEINRAAEERIAKRDKAIHIAQSIAQGLIVVALAVIGFAGSWQHLRDLGILAGQAADVWYGTANLTPVSVDLMLIGASIQLRRKKTGRVGRVIARICSLSGLLISIAGNVLVAWLHLPSDASSLQVAYTLIWSAVPVLSLLGAVEMLTHTRKDLPTRASKPAPKAKGANASAAPRTRKVAAISRDAAYSGIIAG
jgi:hypothetical protein